MASEQENNGRMICYGKMDAGSLAESHIQQDGKEELYPQEGL